MLADSTALEAYSWLLLKHHEVYEALRNHETLSSDFPPIPKGSARFSLIQDEPPRHAVMRRRGL